MLQDNVYFCVQAWMVTKLKLKGAERDIFAIIHGYCMDGKSEFYGSLSYLSELTGYSRTNICNVLKNLTDKKLLIKSERMENNIKFVKYSIDFNTVKEICTPIKKTLTPVKETLINNIKNNIKENNNIVINNYDKNLSQLNNSQSNTIQEKDTVNNFLGSAKVKKKVSLQDIVNAYTDNKELKEAIWCYVNAFNERCKNENKKGGMLPNVLKGQLKQLDKLSNGNDVEKINIMYYSIGYYKPYKPSNNSAKPKNTSVNVEGEDIKSTKHNDKQTEEVLTGNNGEFIFV